MNQNAPQLNFELPPLPGEGGGDFASRAPEMPLSPERASQPPVLTQNPPAGPITTDAPVTPIAPMSQPATSAAQAATSSLTADDNDLIEKEWIVKAKQIVAATREDPHTQNKELSKIKADYLKKRYGKDIKVDES